MSNELTVELADGTKRTFAYEVKESYGSPSYEAVVGERRLKATTMDILELRVSHAANTEMAKTRQWVRQHVLCVYPTADGIEVTEWDDRISEEPGKPPIYENEYGQLRAGKPEYTEGSTRVPIPEGMDKAIVNDAVLAASYRFGPTLAAAIREELDKRNTP